MFFLGIFPKPMPPPSVHLGIEMWILAKFRIKNVNFLAKNNGHQNFTKGLGILPTPFYLGNGDDDDCNISKVTQLIW